MPPRASPPCPVPPCLLTPKQVGEWLQIEPRQVARLGVPWIDMGRKTRRYRPEDVRVWLEHRRREAA